MDAVYDFDESFQERLLALAFHGVVNASIISPDYFINPLHSEVCDSILALQSQYDGVTSQMLRTHLLRKSFFKDPENKSELLDVFRRFIKPVKPAERQYVFDLALRFKKMQQFRHLLMQGIDIIQDQSSDTVDRLDTLLKEMTTVISADKEDLGEFYFSTLHRRLQERNNPPDILATLIPPLDACLDGGGFYREDLVLFAGLTSAGKSFSLLHVTDAAILQKKKVVFYSLEMTTHRLASRLDAKLAGVETMRIREYGLQVERAMERRLKQYGDALLLKRMPAGRTKVSDLKNHLDAVKYHFNFVPDVLVLDYINLMAPEQSSKEGRHRDLGSVYVDLKGLNQERGLWTITAAQANREGFKSPLITSRDLADSFEGAMHADTVITLNRNDDESEQERIRIYIAKDRNGIDKKIIKGFTNYGKGAFWSQRKYREHQREEEL